MYKNILVPVAFDEHHDTQGSLLIAQALAEDDAKFTILHVMDAVPAYVSYQIPGDVLARARDEVEGQMNKLAQSIPGASAVLISGHAGRTIIDYASEHGMDCIVMASHRPGLENYFLGSTADRVVRHAQCSVHVIR